MTQIELIKSRRTIRKFTDREISDAQLHELLEAVQWSPSWANSQCWEVIVIKNAERKEELQALLSETNPAREAMVKAPVILALCGELKKAGCRDGEARTKLGDWMMYDLGIVTQNISLAAHGAGLGSVIVGSFKHDEAQRILGVPNGYQVVSFIAVGHPNHNPSPPKRRGVVEFTHYEKFER